MSEKVYYEGRRLPPLPGWLIAVKLVVIAPVTLLALLHSVLQGAADIVEWSVKGRCWVTPFDRASDRIERWWYSRAIRKIQSDEEAAP